MLARLGLVTLAALSLAACDRSGSAAVWASGSATVYPFTRAVADAFVAADSARPAPRIESPGTEAGLRAFCAGLGGESTDIADASRRMRRAEFDKCTANGVKDIVEVPIGLDGVALAEAAQGLTLQLSRKDLYLALAANPRGKPNAARTWRDVNPALPAVAIRVFGPSAGSGTRDAFVELLMQPGCLEVTPDAKALQGGKDPAAFDKACRQIRSDGVYAEKGEDFAAIVGAVEQEPQALGLIGYSYLEAQKAKLRGVPIDGVAPELATISAGKYPGGRTLYLYTKKLHIEKKQGLKDFLALYASMWGPDGPLAKRGLIPMSDNARRRAKEAIDLMLPLDGASLQ